MNCTPNVPDRAGKWTEVGISRAAVAAIAALCAAWLTAAPAAGQDGGAAPNYLRAVDKDERVATGISVVIINDEEDEEESAGAEFGAQYWIRNWTVAGPFSLKDKPYAAGNLKEAVDDR